MKAYTGQVRARDREEGTYERKENDGDAEPGRDKEKNEEKVTETES